MYIITYDKESKVSKMISFDKRFAEVHKKIQKDTELVRTLFDVVERSKPNVVESGEDKRIYFPTDCIHNNIHLGVDLNKVHIMLFPQILAKMRLVYEVSNGKVDIPSIYALLASNRECKYYDCEGIVVEDFSLGRKLIVGGECGKFDNPYFSLLTHVFDGCDAEDISHSTFSVSKRIPASTKIQILRTPIADLDHLDIAEKYRKKYDKYYHQYKKGTTFRIYGS